MISAGRLGAKNGNFSIRPIAAGGIPIRVALNFLHDRLATVLTVWLCQALARERASGPSSSLPDVYHDSVNCTARPIGCLRKMGEGWNRPKDIWGTLEMALVQPTLTYPPRSSCPSTSILPCFPNASGPVGRPRS